MSHEDVEKMRYLATHQPARSISVLEYIELERECIKRLADEVERLQHKLEEVDTAVRATVGVR